MKIRTYENGDEKEILLLDHRLETHPWNRRDLNNWYWKYTDQNPSGKSFIWLIEKDHKIIAHFAAVPYRLKVFDMSLIASHTIAALVEEEYQNRGLLKFIGDKLFEELGENNIPFTYGFPNKRSYGLHKSHMGYSDLIEFDNWQITGAEILEVKRCGRGNPSLLLQEIEEFDSQFDSLWEKCLHEYKICVVRNKDYLNWRYLRRPDARYYPIGAYREGELKGYVVLKLYREDKTLRGHILDIFAHHDDKDTLNTLIYGSLNFFNERNVDEATCWIWGNELIENLFMENSFKKSGLKVPLVIRVNKEFKCAEKVKDKDYWYFTMGDSTEIF